VRKRGGFYSAYLPQEELIEFPFFPDKSPHRLLRGSIPDKPSFQEKPDNRTGRTAPTISGADTTIPRKREDREGHPSSSYPNPIERDSIVE
jgi:hypothetical protein